MCWAVISWEEMMSNKWKHKDNWLVHIFMPLCLYLNSSIKRSSSLWFIPGQSFLLVRLRDISSIGCNIQQISSSTYKYGLVMQILMIMKHVWLTFAL
jgi:hypothetical protein